MIESGRFPNLVERRAWNLHMLHGVEATKAKYTIQDDSVLGADLALRIVHSINIGDR